MLTTSIQNKKRERERERMDVPVFQGNLKFHYHFLDKCTKQNEELTSENRINRSIG